MSFTHTLHWRGATGSHKRAEGSEYTAVYRVISTDAQAQAQSVINWFRTNVVELGDDYAYAGDSATTTAIANRISAERDLESVDTWVVVVSYGQADDPEEGKDENGNPTDIPTEFRATIRAWTVDQSEPVESAKYLGGYKLFAHGIIGLNNRVIPMNSALVPFHPGLEREVAYQQIEVIRNLAAYDGDGILDVMNRVNTVRFRINRDGFTKTCEAMTARINYAKADLRLQSGEEFWEAVVGVLHNPDGWDDEIADRGLHARAAAGDPDGRGDSFTADDPRFVPGVPKVRRLLDEDEQPIAVPVLLNGDGRPLDPNAVPAGETLEPVMGRWLKYEETNFLDIPFFDPIIF
ncbi:MAG: hypothetical protein ACPGWS_04905 [Solirubrobacterales bacterium]